MRPLFDTVGWDLPAAGMLFATGAGGASAATTSGLDSVGGGGPVCVEDPGAGVFDELGSFTVAVCFSESPALWGGGWLAIISAGVAGWDGGRGGPV